MSTYLNIARSAKAAGRRITIIGTSGIRYTGLVDYFFEASENTEPGCGICLNTDGWCGRYFNEQDILSIEIA